MLALHRDDVNTMCSRNAFKKCSFMAALVQEFKSSLENLAAFYVKCRSQDWSLALAECLPTSGLILTTHSRNVLLGMISRTLPGCVPNSITDALQPFVLLPDHFGEPQQNLDEANGCHILQSDIERRDSVRAMSLPHFRAIIADRLACRPA
jgi:hypothetical protein